MKKLIVVLFCLSLFFVACGKEEVVEPVPSRMSEDGKTLYLEVPTVTGTYKEIIIDGEKVSAEDFVKEWNKRFKEDN